MNLLEIEQSWEEYSDFKPTLSTTKRYQIVNTDTFNTEEDALKYIELNQPFRLRPKTAGCVFINTEEKQTKYLFFVPKGSL
ncbi:hypothetical protein CMI37_08795 [Candidatus Pacearchaeota archaeon]|nr:hypothetical protein [Candidatus Pacearchaeota archaeon]